MIESLYTITLAEAVLGGGGRLLGFGPLTARMLFFGACVALWLLTLASRKANLDGQHLAGGLIACFIATHLPALCLDLLHGASALRIIEEIRPLLFLCLAPFVAMALTRLEMAQRSASMIVFGGSLVALTTILIQAALALDLLSQEWFYDWTWDSGELFFRNDILFFYKGHFYVALALVFAIILRPRWWVVFAVILSIALAASLTRGLIAACIFSVLLGLTIERRYLAVLLIGGLGGALFVLNFEPIWAAFFNDPSRNISLTARISDMRSFTEGYDLRRLIIGEGFTKPLNNRNNVENSYLWAIWRFGILGLFFWVTPFLISAYFYRNIYINEINRKLGTAFFCGIVMMYLVTATNPFINNSIGIVYTLIAMFSLRRLDVDGHPRSTCFEVAR